MAWCNGSVPVICAFSCMDVLFFSFVFLFCPPTLPLCLFIFCLCVKCICPHPGLSVSNLLFYFDSLSCFVLNSASSVSLSAIGFNCPPTCCLFARCLVCVFVYIVAFSLMAVSILIVCFPKRLSVVRLFALNLLFFVFCKSSAIKLLLIFVSHLSSFAFWGHTANPNNVHSSVVLAGCLTLTTT